MTDAADNFNRADGSLGTNWTDSPSFPGLVISSDTVVAPTATWNVAYWNANPIAADQHSQCTFASGTYAGPVVRHSLTDSSFYFVFVNGFGPFSLFRCDSGTFVGLGTAGTAHIGDVVKLEAIGSTLTVFQNGTNVLSVTDTTYSSGQPGIGANAGGVDDWSGGPFAGNIAASSGVGAASVVGASLANSVVVAAGTGAAAAFAGGSLSVASATGTGAANGLSVVNDLTDNFNRTNGALGGNWVPAADLSAPTIISNQCAGGGSSIWWAANWNSAVNTFSNDQHAQITEVSGIAGVILRSSMSGFYLAFIQPGNPIGIFKYGGPGLGFSSIGTGTTNCSAGDTIEFEIIGSNWTVRLNGVVDQTGTDTTFTAGQPGIATYDTAVADNWSGGPVAGANLVTGVGSATGVGAATARVSNPIGVAFASGVGAASGATSSSVFDIPVSRRTDWSYTGVPGGIPNYTSISATFSPGATAAAINAAIAACPPGGVVFLNGGTYSSASLGGAIQILKSNVVLRGNGFAGSNPTILKGLQIINFGTNNNTVLGTAITAGGIKGTFTITVASTASLSVGTVIEIDRLNDPNLVVVTSTYQDGVRDVTQVNMITGISGNVVTVRNPWFYDFSAGSPRVKFAYTPITQLSGVENLRLDHTGFTNGYGFFIQNCDSCWIKGVESAFCSEVYHMILLGTLNCEVRQCYIHDNDFLPNNSGLNFFGNYLYGGNSNAKVEDNIFNQDFPAIEINGSSNGLYIGYNYVFSAVASPPSVTYTFTNCHAPFNIMNLFEGNIAESLGADSFYGGSGLTTYCRNYATGYNPQYGVTGDAITIKCLQYQYNLVGNVLGSTLQIPINYDSTCGAPGIYSLGYPNIGNCDTTRTTPDGFTNPPNGYPDPKVRSTMLRWGNYDYFHNATQFNTSEIPSDVPVQSSHTIPNSYVYTSTPSWWPGGVPWPPIGPDVSGGNGDTSGHVNKIPAQLRFESSGVTGWLGSAAGIGTAHAVGSALSTAAYHASGIGTAAAASPVTAAVGSTAGIGTANATGSAASAAAYHAGGVGAAVATSPVIAAIGSASGVGMALAAGAGAALPGGVPAVAVGRRLLGRKRHTAGARLRYTVDYSDWLETGERLTGVAVVSSSATTTVEAISSQPTQIRFYLDGGIAGEEMLVSLTVTDSLGQTKLDAAQFLVIPP